MSIPLRLFTTRLELLLQVSFQSSHVSRYSVLRISLAQSLHIRHCSTSNVAFLF